jgi:excinuclease UvrABC nuclease subunit
MNLQFSLPFNSHSDSASFFESVPHRPAVFALFPPGDANLSTPPYLGRTRDLRRRLVRLLSARREPSKMLNLRDVVARVDYQVVGSGFEAQWLLYQLHRAYYPDQYRHRLRLRPPALLKLNLRNRFPRCYPTRRLTNDGSLYYGPFSSQVAAERFAAEFLDFFKIRRCVEDLDPHPSHPGCIYSQLRMCLAPCYAGCTDAEYQDEVARVVEFLDAQGRPLLRSLESERALASDALQFEEAARIHRRIEKLHEILRQKADLARNLRELNAIVVERGAEPNSVAFFWIAAGRLRGPATFCFDENAPAPAPLDQLLQNLLAGLAAGPASHDPSGAARRIIPPHASQAPAPGGVAARGLRASGSDEIPAEGAPPSSSSKEAASLPPWEHLSLLTRWYYSSFREGELVMLNPDHSIPHSRLIRACRKLLAS